MSQKKSRTPAKPVYKGPPGPANRFNIPPGYRYAITFYYIILVLSILFLRVIFLRLIKFFYRWDGIDRGNGFEKELFKAQAHKQANKDEAYLWSVEDM